MPPLTDLTDGAKFGSLNRHHALNVYVVNKVGGEIIIWAGVVDNELVRPFRIPEGGKMTSATYVDILKRMFVPWF